MNQPRNILIVDDNPEQMEHFIYHLRDAGYHVDTAISWTAGIEAARSRKYYAIFLDMHLGHSEDDGHYFLHRMAKENINTPTAICSIHANATIVRQSVYRYNFVLDIFDKLAISRNLGQVDAFFEKAGGTQCMSSENTQERKGINMPLRNRIFVVYGRDLDTRDRVVKILHSLHTDPILIDREASGGNTIIELVEKYTDTSYAVIIMSADDVGFLKVDTARTSKPRARQNVIFESGYLFGSIGRERVTLLVDPDIEIPSDLDGVMYISLDKEDHEIREFLMRNFDAVGSVDYRV